MIRKMRKSCLLVIGALLLVLTGAATQSEAGVNVNIGINLPAIRFAAPPDMVVIPGTYVYMVPDIDVQEVIMDKSPHYIKMCESAKVIQKQWKPEFGDFFVSRSLGLTSPCQPIMSDLEKKVSYEPLAKACKRLHSLIFFSGLRCRTCSRLAGDFC